MKIFKYGLQRKPGIQRLVMPGGSKILSVQVQCNEPMLWAVVTPEVAGEQYNIWMFETEQEMPPRYSDWNFIGTLQFDNGNYVLHCFTD